MHTDGYRLYIVEEDVSASEWAVVGYYSVHWHAWQEFAKSQDRRIRHFESDNAVFVPTIIEEHSEEDDEL